MTNAAAEPEWLIVTEEVERLCAAILTNFGVDLAQNILSLFKQLDKRQVITLEEFTTRELRKKVRHLLQAFCISVVDAKKVPGAKDVPVSFKKPSDCHISLATFVKPYLVEAAKKIALSAPEKDSSPRVESAQKESQSYEDRRAFLEEALLRARRDIEDSLEHDVAIAEPPPREDEEGPVPASIPEQHKGGMLSLDEYKRMRDAGADMHPHFTRHRAEDDAETAQLSLMQLRQMGKLKPSPEELRKYEEAREKHTALWGASKSKQQRILQETERKAERREDRKRLREGSDDSGADEPWNRFDREKLFESLNATRSTKKGFDEFMELAAERKAAFAREGTGGGKRRQY